MFLFQLTDLTAQTWLFLLFAAAILGFLIVDLGVFQRKAHKISFKSAAWQSAFWVTLSMLFAGLVWHYNGTQPALEFISAYLMEWSLSVDNIFVFVILLKYFKVEEQYQHRVLFYGILGAIIFRAIFITAGIALVEQFHWLLYVFGVILIITGYKMLVKNKEEQFDPSKSGVYKFLCRKFRFIDTHSEGKFFIRQNGRLYATTLFLVIIMIETTDIIFAIDSIPAVFAITQDRFIIYTSNIFAVMGLRAMFFLLANVVNRFRFLQHGISIILIFIGAKMLLEMIDIHVPIYISLTVIVVALAVSISASILLPEKIITKKSIVKKDK